MGAYSTGGGLICKDDFFVGAYSRGAYSRGACSSVGAYSRINGITSSILSCYQLSFTNDVVGMILFVGFWQFRCYLIALL